jgi:spermidine/putrescine transport system substrate-binding protein
MKQDPRFQALIRQAAASPMTRRSLLAGAGGSLILAGLAACAPAGNTLTPAKDISDTDKKLAWANWPYYIDVDEAGAYPTIVAFEAATGIKVTYEEAIPTNEEFYAKVKDNLNLGKDIGYDVMTLTDYFAARMVRQGLVQPLGIEDMPNASKNLLPAYQDISYDPGRKYSLPWQSGMTGLAWSKAWSSANLTTVDQLWDPALKGKIALLDQWTDTMAVIMQSQGVDISGNWGDDEYNAAIELLTKQVQDGQVRAFTGNDYTELFKSGDIVAAFGWSGDIFTMNTEAGSDAWGFQLPTTGGFLWSDNFMIPMGSPHKKNAQALIDYYYQPEVAAQVAAYVNYVTPVAGAQQAMESIDPTLATNEFIFPTESTLSRAKALRQITPEEDKKYATLFEKAKVG